MQVSDLPAGQRHRADVHDYLFELVSQRCSVSTSASQSVAVGCSLQRTLNSWNRCTLKIQRHMHILFFIIHQPSNPNPLLGFY